MADQESKKRPSKYDMLEYVLHKVGGATLTRRIKGLPNPSAGRVSQNVTERADPLHGSVASGNPRTEVVALSNPPV